jgi:hypothetical protein
MKEAKMVYLFMLDLTEVSGAFIIQGDSGGKGDILEWDSIGHYEKIVYMNLCLIVFGNRGGDFSVCTYKSIVNCNKERDITH